MITCGAYLGWIFIEVIHLPIAFALSLAALGSAALGLLLQFALYGPLVRRKASGLVLLLASLGLYIVIQNSISLVFGDQFRAYSRTGINGAISIFGAQITKTELFIFAFNLILYGGVNLVAAKTSVGRITRAVANDPELAIIYGINQQAVLLGVFAAGSAMAGIAGVLIGFDSSVNPTMGFDALLMGVVAAIVGGVGSLAGAIVGGFFIGFLQAFGVWQLPTEWQYTVVFFVLMMFLIFRPQGFFGQALRPTSS